MDQDRNRAIRETVETMVLTRRDILSSRKIPPGDHAICRGQGVVLAIAGNQDRLGIKEVAERMDISGSAATQLVDSLVKEGLLTREVDPNDRRIMRFSLTDEGKSRLQKFRKALVEAMSKVSISLDEQEIETFRNLLRKITAANLKSREARPEK